MVVYECTDSALWSLLRLLKNGNGNIESPTWNFNKICRRDYRIHKRVHLGPCGNYGLLSINMTENCICLVPFAGSLQYQISIKLWDRLWATWKSSFTAFCELIGANIGTAHQLLVEISHGKFQKKKFFKHLPNTRINLFTAIYKLWFITDWYSWKLKLPNSIYWKSLTSSFMKWFRYW
jgi:hypothetical protein